jgi:type I restriction enzyme S subunit
LNWNSIQIEKTCLRTRMRDPRRNPETPFFYVDISAIDRRLKVITSAPEILGADAPSRARKEICEGDILVSTVRPNLNAVAIVPQHLDGQIASTGFCVLRPNKSAIVGKYLFYFTTTPNFVGILSGKVRGAHYPAVSDNDVKEIELPLPSLSEQRRIVEILDQANALRKKRAEADEKAARILPALFYKMFGDPATNMTTEHWPLTRISDVADVSYGLADRLDSAVTANQGTRIVTISNVTLDGQIDDSVERYTIADSSMLKKATLIRDDLLFNWRNGSKQHVGKTAIWEDNWSGNVLHVSFLLRIRPNKEHIDPYYLWALLNLLRAKGFFIAQSRMQINSKFNASELSALRIPVPSLSLQLLFADKIRIIRSIKFKQSGSIEKLNTLFKEILYRAFTGDLTSRWRESHIKELLAEMELQAKILEITKVSKENTK